MTRASAIEPAEVYLPIHFGRALLFFTREAELVFVGSPLAALGCVNHVLPYQLVKWIARKLSTDRDHWASNTVYPGCLVFPFFYAVQLGAAWLLLPMFWAAVYTESVPSACGVDTCTVRGLTAAVSSQAPHCSATRADLNYEYLHPHL